MFIVSTTGEGTSILMGGANIRRICTGPLLNQAYCTPFFEKFTNEFPLFELISSGQNYSRSGVQLNAEDYATLSNYLNQLTSPVSIIINGNTFDSINLSHEY